MKKLIVIFTIIFSGIVFGQVNQVRITNKPIINLKEKLKKNYIFNYKETDTREFYFEELEKFKNRIIESIEMSKFWGLTSKFSISFIVEKDGSISNFQITDLIKNEKTILLLNDIKDIISKKRITFKPATINNKKVRASIEPFDFEINIE